MDKWITCIRQSQMPQALTRGKQYAVVELDESKGQVRVRGDNLRTRWFPVACFDMDGKPAPTVVRWWFVDKVEDEISDLVDVSFELSDGTLRWCWVGTPDYLKQLLEARSDPAQWGGAYEPAVWGPHLIVIRRLAHDEVDWVLRHIDQEGALMATSLPFEPSDEEEDDTD
jgi:hypothetical protein